MNNWSSSLRLAALCLFVCFCWVLLHEGGHVAATLATGGEVTEVVIFSVKPHIKVHGVSTPWVNALKCVAGSGLFLSVWFLFVALAPARKMGLPINVSSFFAGIELLAWTMASLQYPGGTRSYDVWKFLAFSGISSWTVAALSLSIGIAGYTLLRVKQHAAESLAQFTVPVR